MSLQPPNRQRPQRGPVRPQRPFPQPKPTNRNLAQEFALGVGLAAIGFALFLLLLDSRSRNIPITWFDLFVALSFGVFAGGCCYAVMMWLEWKESEGATKRRVDSPDLPRPAKDVPSEDEVIYPLWESDAGIAIIPDSVSFDDLVQVQKAKREGRLTAVSLRSLTEIGVSRWKSEPPNAASMKKFLVEQKVITHQGDWTEWGDRFFTPPVG